MPKKFAVLCCALVFLLCAIPIGGLSAGAFRALKTGDTLTVTGSETAKDGTAWYTVKLADGTRAYLRQDALVADLNALLTDSVWITRGGQKYHKTSDCSHMKSPLQVTQSEAERLGYTPCKRCYPSDTDD